MPKYRKIALVVEAEKITVYNIARVAEWCGGKHVGTRLPAEQQAILINTNNGEVEATVGTWVVKGLNDFYPCDDKTFSESYEEARG
jgi:hypothetical protein